MIRHAALSLALVTAIGCSSSAPSSSAPPASTTGRDGGAAVATKDGGSTTTKSKPKTTVKTSSLKNLAGNAPPAGAKSQGTATKPKVGAITVPIQSVEVFLIQADFDGDGTDEQVSWAHVDEGATYLWLTAPVTCDDGSSDATGAFMMEVKSDGTGSYLFSLAGCPSSDLFGCDFDASGSDTTCGACSVEGENVACVVAGQ